MRSKTMSDLPIEKLYYSIKEIAERYECAASKIRFWCEFFDISPPRNKNGNRQFEKKTIAKLDQIHYLVEVEGRRLDSAAAILNNKVTFKLEGHGENCQLCSRETSALSANPTEWPRQVIDKWYHQGCLQLLIEDRLPEINTAAIMRMHKLETGLLQIIEMAMFKDSRTVITAREALHGS